MELNITLLIQLVIFLFGLIWLSFVLFKPMLKLLEERERRIAGVKREAEQLAAAGSEKSGVISIRLEEARSQALAQRAELRQEGQKVYGTLVEKARNEALSKLATARDEIEAARKQAEAQLRTDAQELAKLIVERVVDRSGGAA